MQTPEKNGLTCLFTTNGCDRCDDSLDRCDDSCVRCDARCERCDVAVTNVMIAKDSFSFIRFLLKITVMDLSACKS